MTDTAPISSIEWGNVAQWLGAVATSFAVIVALFKEDIVRRWWRPELTVRILPQSPDSLKETMRYDYPSEEPRTHENWDRYMFRLWVFNEGNARAEQVQVLTEKLEKQSANGKTFDPVEEYLPMNLFWANTYTPTPYGRIGKPFMEGISRKMGDFCDLGHVTEPHAREIHCPEEMHPEVSPNLTSMTLDVQFKHSGRAYILKPGIYRLHLQIGGANFSPKRKILEIAITGEWHGDPRTMFRDGIKISVISD